MGVTPQPPSLHGAQLWRAALAGWPLARGSAKAAYRPPRTVGSASSPGRSLLASGCAFFFSPSAIVRSAYSMGVTAAVLLVRCAWDSGPSPCSSFLPVFVHPISKCHAKVVIWAASVWSIKTGVILEGPFTGPTQCTNECEVLRRLLCVTNTDTAKTAKCKLL